VSGLEAGIKAYEKALCELPPQSAEGYAEAVRGVLLARDEVAAALTGSPRISARQHARIAAADKRLKAQAPYIRDGLDADAFTHWREVGRAPEGAWWWSLDRVAAETEAADLEKDEERNALWILLTALLVTVSLGLLAEIVRRFFSGGSDWLSVVNTFVQAPLLVLQAGLGLIAAGSLTEPGRQWAERLLKLAGLYRGYGAKKRLAVAVTVLVVVVAFRLSLPYIARLYNERAARQVEGGDVSAALLSYQRALSLNPDYPEAHYNLATIYEQLQKYDEAITEYQTAVRLDSRLQRAQSALARLYLRRGKDEDLVNALEILDREIAQFDANALGTEEGRNLQYALYKNRGWAAFKLNKLPQAESDLRKAIEARPDGGAAHCLLAYVLEAKKEPADGEWEDCIRLAPGEEDVDPRWLQDATER
jgi:tetratricopeptide (TPR) repeat protein